jgi:hypothetical protein
LTSPGYLAPTALAFSLRVWTPAAGVRPLNRVCVGVAQGLPTVLSDCPVLGDRSAGTSKPGLFPKWNFDYLVGALGDAPTHDNWSAMVSETDKHRFIPYNEGLNVFGSYYHVRVSTSRPKP